MAERPSTAAVAVLATLATVAAPLPAQQPQQYPEGTPIPASLTPLEREWVLAHPLTPERPTTPPPSGPIHCAAEYEPADGILIAWEGSSAQLNILRQMAVRITTTGQARVFVYCDSTTERSTVQSTLQAAGCDMGRVVLLVQTTDTIWIRDYGPRYVFEGDCRAIVDHTYNRPRPNDDQVPWHFGAQHGHRVYGIPLVHGGGNYHLDAVGRSHSTRLVVNENPALSEQQIHDLWFAYQNLHTTFYTPFPTSVDLTQHIDMWMQVFADQGVVVSDWPADAGSPQDQICDGAAQALAARGYAVHRVPARSVGGVHYTYTNVVLCNDLALVPSYRNATVAPHNAQALAAWTAALPGKTVVQIDCEDLVSYAGVMHCIAMHVPRHRGGLVPTAYVKTPNGGQSLLPGQQVLVEWLADDDEAVAAVDVLLSLNGGTSFPYTVAAGLAHTGSFTWTVPNLYAPLAKLRVVARDTQGRQGHDDSDVGFAILGTGCRAEAVAYGTGKAGSNGVPALSASPPVLGTVFAVQLQNALANAGFLFLMGDQPAALPFDGGTILIAIASGFTATTGPAGDWLLPVPLPDEPVLCGATVYAQAWIPNDPGASGAGWAASNGLRVVLGH
jgi:agmatine/peptidylarginine deiminase